MTQTTEENTEEDIAPERPDVIEGCTHKLKIPTADGVFSFYVTINKLESGKPYEMFVNCKNASYAEHMTALTVLVSRMLRSGVDIKVIADDLQSIHSPETGHMMPGGGGRIPSLHARIGKLLE